MAHRISPEAEVELDDIWYYLARASGSVDVAERVVASIAERFYLLAMNPFIGRRRDDDLRPGLRSFVAGEYVILYRVEGENVLILNVVRGSRDISMLFGR